MPQITITETDRTTAGTAPYSNYAVAIAGFVDPALYNSQSFDAVADANGILTLESQDDFNKYVFNTTGTPCEAITDADVKGKRFGQIGAQAAYYVLGLGLPVVYVVLNQTGLKVSTPAATDIDKEKAEPSDALTGNTSCWSPLIDKAEYDVRYIMTGLDPEHATAEDLKEANKAIAALAKGPDGTENANVKGRGDCIALIDLAITKKACSQYDAINNALTEVNGYGDAELNCYSAAFAQKVELDAGKFNYSEYPGSLYYVACKKYAIDRGYAEWFAAAGYARGTSRSPIKAAMPRMADAAVQKLEPRHQEDTANDPKFAVNVISLIRGVYYLYGNRTCHALNDPQQPDLVASDFLNVRELCCTLKKTIYETCKRLMFNPNSDVLWTSFTSAIRPTLESMKANQGIDAYSIRQLASTRKGEMRARILIKPIEAVENFHIDLELVDSVEGETEVTISE